MIEHAPSTPTAPARVVVLGASGMIGRAISRALPAVDVPMVGLGSGDLDLCAADGAGRLRELLRPDDSVVLVSAITPDRGRDLDTFMRNLAMGRTVARVVEESACAHLVYISSDAVYGDDANPVRETSPCDAPSLHGLMHFTRERMLGHAASLGRTPMAALRVGLVYGPADTHNSYGPNRFLRTARAEGKITLFGDGEEKRDHIYVEDVAAVVVRCLMHRSRGTLNVVTGVSTPFRAVAELVARLVGAEIVCLPRQAPITHRHFDVRARRRAFATFVPTNLADGLAATATASA